MEAAIKKYENNTPCTIYHFPIPIKENVKYTKTGQIKKTVSHKYKGRPSKVYPLMSIEEIDSIKGYYRSIIENAKTERQRKWGYLHLTIFIVGISTGLRISDLIKLKLQQVFCQDGSFQCGIRVKMKKTNEYITFFLNRSAKKAILEYVEELKIDVMSDKYLFPSRQQGRGAGESIPIGDRAVGTALKQAAKSCGINRNINTHTLRKTFSRFQIIAHKDDVNFLISLQKLLGHNSIESTMAYAGFEDDKNEQYFNDVNL